MVMFIGHAKGILYTRITTYHIPDKNLACPEGIGQADKIRKKGESCNLNNWWVGVTETADGSGKKLSSINFIVFDSDICQSSSVISASY